MNSRIGSHETVVAFPPGEVIFVGQHPLYRMGEEGEVRTLIFAQKSDTPFGPQSSHAMFQVVYADGYELFAPLYKFSRYRVFMVDDELRGLNQEDNVILSFQPHSAFYQQRAEAKPGLMTMRAEVMAIVYEYRSGKSPRAVFSVRYPGSPHTVAVPVRKHDTYRVWFD